MVEWSHPSVTTEPSIALAREDNGAGLGYGADLIQGGTHSFQAGGCQFWKSSIWGSVLSKWKKQVKDVKINQTHSFPLNLIKDNHFKQASQSQWSHRWFHAAVRTTGNYLFCFDKDLELKKPNWSFFFCLGGFLIANDHCETIPICY